MLGSTAADGWTGASFRPGTRCERGWWSACPSITTSGSCSSMASATSSRTARCPGSGGRCSAGCGGGTAWTPRSRPRRRADLPPVHGPGDGRPAPHSGRRHPGARQPAGPATRRPRRGASPSCGSAGCWPRAGGRPRSRRPASRRSTAGSCRCCRGWPPSTPSRRRGRPGPSPTSSMSRPTTAGPIGSGSRGSPSRRCAGDPATGSRSSWSSLP